MRIGDGNSTNIWGKDWLPTEDDGYVSSEVQAGIELAKVCDLMAIEGRMCETWMLSLNYSMLAWDRELIIRIPLSTIPTEDTWYRIYNKGGKI